jgi:hypothetical protein
VKIKRYMPISDGCWNEFAGSKDDGLYVLYADHLKAMRALKKRLSPKKFVYRTKA